MKKQVVVIHGGDSFDNRRNYLRSLRWWPVTINSFLSRRDWKADLPNALGPRWQVLQPRMPNSSNARYVEWKIWFERMLPFIRQGVILVGHSLGAAFLVRYLATHKYPKNIKAVILVAAPHNYGEVGDFCIPLSLRRLTRQCKNVFFFHSPDDPIVPFSELSVYAKALPSATTMVLKKRGHFNQARFPELVKILKNL